MKRSIITRLYIGFAAAIILVLGVGVSSYQTIQHQTSSGQWVEHTYEVMNKTRNLQLIVVRMRGAGKIYYITGDARFMVPYKVGIATIFKECDELKALVLDNPIQVSRADSLTVAIRELVYFWESLKVSDTSTREYKTALMLQEDTHINKMNDIIRDFYSEEQRMLSIRKANDADANSLATWVLIAGIALVLVIVVVLIYFILKEFTQRTQAEEGLKKSIQHVTELNITADKRNWQLTGVGEVNNSLQGNATSDDIIQNILASIIKYLELPAGALYLVNDNGEELVLKGSIGVPANKPESYVISQLPGGVPPKNEIKIIKNVPAFFWQLQSALGEAVPGEVAIIPLYFDNTLMGAIELANFAIFSEAEIELLKTIANNLGLALNTAMSNEKVLKLLEQVQEQRETLENQQEELRQSNEELTRQTEILQASEEELKVQEEELRHINTELEEKNEAVEMARQALQVKAKELDEISRYKSEFLANMSHELRTPLNSILILANMLAENKTSNLSPKQVEYSHIIHKSGTDLLNLINDILDLSKIEAGKIDIQIEETSISGMVEDVTPPFNVLADSKKLHFTTIVDAGVPKTIKTDKQRLEQIIKNLLSNAFKFTPEGGSIVLHFAVTGDNEADNKLCILVKDTGVGIPADKQRLIFEAFQQADGSTSRRYGGTGLGLSISRELIRILGGQITVASQQGAGSTFTIQVPLQAGAIVSKQAEQPVMVLNKIPDNIPQQTQIKDDRNDILQGDKVMLIIEDDVKFAYILQSFARDRNYKTVVAISGDEGLVCAAKYVPAAIILDLQLPVLDGWSILKTLKANHKLKHIPVHIISVDETAASTAEGAIAYLKKPVTKEALEKAFSDIGSYLRSYFKKILFFSLENTHNGNLQKLLNERRMDAAVTYTNSLPQTIAALKEEAFDCVIVDISGHIADGIEKLTSLKDAGVLDTQVIICLDRDISREDEWKLKKFSSIVIRDSAQAQQRLIDELELFLHKIQQAQKTPLSSAGTITDDNTLAGKKVLLVDDDMRNVFALSVALEEYGMNVLTANDGKEALDVLNKNKDTAIVLMDIMMPEMDGYEAMKHIRDDMKLAKLPVIALTAKAMQGDREKSIQAGASDYITKPVDMGRLLSLMRVWLSQ